MSKSLIYGVKHDYEQLKTEYFGYVEAAERMRTAVVDAATKTRLAQMDEKLDDVLSRADSLPDGLEKDALIAKITNLQRQINTAASVRP